MSHYSLTHDLEFYLTYRENPYIDMINLIFLTTFIIMIILNIWIQDYADYELLELNYIIFTIFAVCIREYLDGTFLEWMHICLIIISWWGSYKKKNLRFPLICFIILWGIIFSILYLIEYKSTLLIDFLISVWIL